MWTPTGQPPDEIYAGERKKEAFKSLSLFLELSVGLLSGDRTVGVSEWGQGCREPLSGDRGTGNLLGGNRSARNLLLGTGTQKPYQQGR